MFFCNKIRETKRCEEEFMTIQISKAAEQALLQQIAKECRKKALRVGGIAAVVAILVFFVITGFPRDSLPFFVDSAFVVVITVLSTFLAYILLFNRQASKHGIEISAPAQDDTRRNYDDLFGYDHMRPSVNPATGLPMAGSVDAGGNAYGSKSSR